MLLPNLLVLLVLSAASPIYSQICVGKTSLPVTYLVSPGYPLPYPSELLCDLLVEPASPSVCNLTLEFDTLALPSCTVPPSPQQWGLVVGGRPLCGAQDSVEIPLQRPYTLISFRGSPDGGDGFNITVKQQECKIQQYNSSSCGGSYSGESVTIVSPGYPSGYPSNLDCKYTITPSAQEVCQVELRFEDSSLENSTNCTKDSLQINGERFCGTLSSERIYEVGEGLEIRLRTDAEGTDKGFQLTAKEILCTSARNFLIQIPDESPAEYKQDIGDCIPNNPEVSYSPIPQEGYIYQKPFLPFPSSGFGKNGPSQEYLPSENSWADGIPDNSGQNSPIVPPLRQYPNFNPSKIPYQNREPQIPLNQAGVIHPQGPFINTNTPVPQEGSSPFNSRYPYGFSYQPVAGSSGYFWPIPPVTGSVDDQCCGRIYTDSNFLIVSPGFPRSQSSDCIYTINRYSPLTYQVRYQFRYFWAGEDTGTGCTGGYLEIDGHRVCGCKTGIIWTSPFLDSEDSKTLHLRLDSSINKLFNGFVIEVFQDDSYSQRFKRVSGMAYPSNGTVSNFSQYIETAAERNPVLVRGENGLQLDRIPDGYLVWDPVLQSWTPPTNILCLRWSIQDWLLLIEEALWAQYQCPVPSSSTVSTVNVVSSEVNQATACRTCQYFCRQKCQCC